MFTMLKNSAKRVVLGSAIVIGLLAAGATYIHAQVSSPCTPERCTRVVADLGNAVVYESKGSSAGDFTFTCIKSTGECFAN